MRTHALQLVIQRIFVRLLILPGCALLAGCEGKSLVDDNPVFTEAPPRLRGTNAADSVGEPRADSVVKSVSHSKSTVELTGNTVVAEVNGTPIFVDDLIGSMRLSLEADPQLSDSEKTSIMREQIKKRLDAFVDQEIVLQALFRAIPEDRRDMIRDSLQEPFQDVIDGIKADNKVETDEQLNEILARQGLSIDLLRESFTRIQMVQGFLSSKVEVSQTVDRIEMVDYYNEHRNEFTSKERVRCQELIINFLDHGGKDAAKEQMSKAVIELQAGKDFADVAMRYSDALSAEKRGDIGWLRRGSLADKSLEDQLFSLQVGEMTQVYVRDDRFEVYRAMDREHATTPTFQEVQKQIEKLILAQRKDAARKKALDDLRETSIVVTMFDDVNATK